MPREETQFEIFPTVITLDERAISALARRHPGVYLRLFDESLPEEARLIPVLNVSDSSTESSESFARVAEVDNQITIANNSSREPAYYWNSMGLRNGVYRIASHGNSSWYLQDATISIYTVQRGTHKGKRLIKLGREGQTLKAAGFLNRDGSFTPWQSSIWSAHVPVHEMIREMLSLLILNQSRQSFYFRADGTRDDETVYASRVHCTCLVCNEVVYGDRNYLCSNHMDTHVGHEIFVVRTGLDSETLSNASRVARSATASISSSQSALRRASEAARAAAAGAGIAAEHEVRRSLGVDDVTDSLRDSLSRPDESERSQPEEPEHQPLLSELGTGKVR